MKFTELYEKIVTGRFSLAKGKTKTFTRDEVYALEAVLNGALTSNKAFEAIGSWSMNLRFDPNDNVDKIVKNALKKAKIEHEYFELLSQTPNPLPGHKELWTLVLYKK